MQTAILAAADLDQLIQLLIVEGFQVIGPVRDQHAILYDQISSAADLPQGWIDQQEKGSYRLEQSPNQAYFGHTVAANSWKKFLNPPRRRLWRASRENGQLVFQAESNEAPPLAFIGVRSCELHAIRIQDAVYIQGSHPDELYRSNRQRLFNVSVNCTRATATCFCASMNTGPEVSLPSDINLTEVIDAEQHYFLVKAGSPAGERIVAQLPTRAADQTAQQAGREAIGAALQQMQTGPRYFDSSDVKELLYRNLESPSWDDVAERCLSCANCTLACPTCFCSAVEDSTDLTGDHAERWQRWDSCFTNDFSYIHGGTIRESTRSRYRQWMTHKLATWIDQFGHSGCVGCGRCISWCPVGIDITEELLHIRAAEAK
ncbi:sulfite reductase subunit A [Pseudomaricurvus alcaniphilus]|uniref:4Fe-4S dicluster domain-containing protein n=1 Tax=Pseudomaricurvus alcaniphilus TaxID=1166482 RepID=UPI00140AA859|nr:4Fe-4S dicluster domain-containing protein [Pseudomaricurvus alcaniphilus]NHN37519.1 sulfite reductase subunit A [Pseudomaricurvus alcaniphilus]